MATTWSRVARVAVLLLITQLSACYDKDNKPDHRTLGVFPKGITFDNEDNMYISTVNGKIACFDGRQLRTLIERGNHGLDLAEKIRYSQNYLYIHNKRYAGINAGYIDEIVLFSTAGEYLDELITEQNIGGTNFADIAVNLRAQLYSLTNSNTTKLFRLNTDKLDLKKFDLSLDPAFTDLISRIRTLLSSKVDDTISGQLKTGIVLLNYLRGNLDFTVEVPQVTETIDAEKTEIINLLLSLLLSPTNITIDTESNVYVSYLLGIVKLDADGNYLNKITPFDIDAYTYSRKLAIDPYGNLVIANQYYENNTTRLNFLKFSPDGRYLGEFIPAGSGGLGTIIEDMAFDSAGNLYVVDMIRGIYKFDHAGQFVDIIIKAF